MDKFYIQLEYSGWWIPVLLIGATIPTLWLYTAKKRTWNNRQNWLLFTIRLLATFLVLFLLLEPSIRFVKNTILKPVITLAIDDSESVIQRGDNDPEKIRSAISTLQTGLDKLAVDQRLYSISNDAELNSFNQPQSDISALLHRAQLKSEDIHHVATILLSDGIFTKGYSPAYENYFKPIFSVGLGDSIPPKDVILSRVRYNKITYSGNTTPIIVQVDQNGYEGSLVKVALKEGEKTIAEKTVTLKNELQEVSFEVTSTKPGIRNIEASVTQIDDEFNFKNNQKNAVIQVIDGRKKILITARGPHPDIKAIKSALVETDSYEVTTYIPAISKQKPSGNYDVIIHHGAFDGSPIFTAKTDVADFFILNNRSSISNMNRSVFFLEVQQKSNRPDQVSGSINPNFSKFKMDDAYAFENFPPLEVPYGDYKLEGPTEILLYQKLGGITTEKPLLAFYDDGNKKSAVLFGENIWKWKLQESAVDEVPVQFNNLILKSIQFLALQNDKKRFSFQPLSAEFNEFEFISFNSESYNDIYERIYGNEVKLKITSKDSTDFAKQFSFVNSPSKKQLKASTLPKGSYNFQATSEIGGETFTDQGAFVVKRINPEFINLTADHSLLRKVSSKTKGSYFDIEELNNLLLAIEKKNFKPKIKSEETSVKLSAAWWYIALILTLFSTEFLLRRLWGGY